ncbi:hypothetical protein FKP32DRAFT_1575152, partial [Trametes sanguinea]
QRLVHVARYAVIFPEQGCQPRRVLLPSKDDWDPACGCPAYTADLDTHGWFRGQQIISPINYFPGTRCRLANGYDIVWTKHRKVADGVPVNETLKELFSVEWPGALLVVKWARRHRGQAIHITSPEIALISTIVHRYVSPAGCLFDTEQTMALRWLQLRKHDRQATQ